MQYTATPTYTNNGTLVGQQLDVITNSIQSSNSGGSAPVFPLVAGQLWFDTGNNLLNHFDNNNAWQTLYSTATTTITLNNSLGVGVAASGVAGEIKATTATLSGSLGVGVASSGVAGEIRATGNVTAYYSSDARLKTNVQAIQDPLGKVARLRGVTFDWTSEYIQAHGGEDGFFTRKHDVGLIAQEVAAVLPEVVATREDGYLALKYDRLTALLVEAVKAQQSQIDELKARLEAK